MDAGPYFTARIKIIFMNDYRQGISVDMTAPCIKAHNKCACESTTKRPDHAQIMHERASYLEQQSSMIPVGTLASQSLIKWCDMSAVDYLFGGGQCYLFDHLSPDSVRISFTAK